MSEERAWLRTFMPQEVSLLGRIVVIPGKRDSGTTDRATTGIMLPIVFLSELYVIPNSDLTVLCGARAAKPCVSKDIVDMTIQFVPVDVYAPKVWWERTGSAGI